MLSVSRSSHLKKEPLPSIPVTPPTPKHLPRDSSSSSSSLIIGDTPGSSMNSWVEMETATSIKPSLGCITLPKNNVPLDPYATYSKAGQAPRLHQHLMRGPNTPRLTPISPDAIKVVFPRVSYDAKGKVAIANVSRETSSDAIFGAVNQFLSEQNGETQLLKAVADLMEAVMMKVETRASFRGGYTAAISGHIPKLDHLMQALDKHGKLEYAITKLYDIAVSGKSPKRREAASDLFCKMYWHQMYRNAQTARSYGGEFLPKRVTAQGELADFNFSGKRHDRHTGAQVTLSNASERRRLGQQLLRGFSLPAFYQKDSYLDQTYTASDANTVGATSPKDYHLNLAQLVRRRILTGLTIELDGRANDGDAFMLAFGKERPQVDAISQFLSEDTRGLETMLSPDRPLASDSFGAIVTRLRRLLSGGYAPFIRTTFAKLATQNPIFAENLTQLRSHTQHQAESEAKMAVQSKYTSRLNDATDSTNDENETPQRSSKEKYRLWSKASLSMSSSDKQAMFRAVNNGQSFSDFEPSNDAIQRQLLVSKAPSAKLHRFLESIRY